MDFWNKEQGELLMDTKEIIAWIALAVFILLGALFFLRQYGVI